MRTPLVLSLVMVGSILVGTVHTSSAAGEALVGGYSNAPVTNMAAEMVKSPVILKGLFRNPRSPTNGLSSAMLPERAVMLSLRWLREMQNADGSWSTDQDPKAVGTALSVLTLLSHGETPASTGFGDSVRKGLEFLVSAQQENGTFEEAGTHPAIAHGIVTLALCEAYGMTRVPRLRDAAEKALEVILSTQRGTGLWDAQYRPANGGDDNLEASAWQVRAVFAGRLVGSQMNGLAEALKAAADGFAVAAGTPDASTAPFAIQPLLMLHRNRDAAYITALDAMKGMQIDWAEPQCDDPIVHWYFTGQALFRHGGEACFAWNRSSVPNLVSNQTVSQREKGGGVGYWDSPGKAEKYGRVYTTALCSLMLQVYSMRAYVPEQPKQDAKDEDIRVEIR
jgi:hypothetical protein